MTIEKRTLFWGAGCVFLVFLLHILSSILLPFVSGILIAYFLDPVTDRLEERGVPRSIATGAILLAFFLFGFGVLTLFFPMLQKQITGLALMLPGMVDALRFYLEPFAREFLAGLSPDALGEIKSHFGQFAGRVAKWTAGLLAGLWSGGLAVFNVLSMLIVMPVVAFYLLRDWDLITYKVDSWLPRRARATIHHQLREIDLTLASFVRGQALVCLVLIFIYTTGLSIVGLKSGLLVGLGAGLISFVPYLGAAIGLLLGVGIALFQFSEWEPVLIVTGIFVFGQMLESYVLTPKFVGDKVGLHPLWIIFALMAGGVLLGFTGVLIAVPVAAVIGVLTRFSIDRYLKSPLYQEGEKK